ncbi:MAG: rhomboid family intramembrane serine protease, partial [Chitinophagaceae bacterium]
MRDRPTQRSLFGASGNTLVMLIAVLAVIFSIFKFIQLAFMLTHADTALASQSFEKNIHQWFVFPATFDVLFSRPWTLLTYLFYHDGVFHLIGNLIWLWVFGFILQDLTG